MVAHVDGAETWWWGGSIDSWRPDETRLSSPAELDRYWKLVREFRNRQLPKAHAMMMYRDGSFASVMLGINTQDAAAAYLTEAMEVARTRSAHPWLKA
jgi:hypothetical protein